jgi:hypothetical protein
MNMDKSYVEDMQSATDKSLNMVKTQLHPLLLEIIKKGNFEVDIEDNNGAFDNVAETVESLLDSLINLSKFKQEKSFDYPLVLSFLAHYALGNCLVPSGYLSQFEFERLQFNSTGLTM